MPAPLTTAIVHTLLHSFWEAAVIALFAALLLTATRRRRAVVQYNLLLLLMGGFSATVVITFLIELGGATAEGPRLTMPAITALIDRYGTGAFIDDHATAMIRIWAGILVLRIGWLGVDVHGLNRLKRVHTALPDSRWSTMVDEGCARLGITRPVRLLESAIIRVPMVIGYLRPLILVPAGLLSHLPPAEVEAILLHELAHIRRGDWLVNGCVQVLQSIFFFNPAVCWLGHMLRTERENCCDDLAVQLTGSKATYVRTLIRFSERDFRRPVFALTFPGAKNATLERIERLAAGRNRALSRLEALLLIVMIGLSAWLVPADNRLRPTAGNRLHPTDSPDMAAKKKAEAMAMQRYRSQK